MDWDNQRPSAPSTPSSMSSQSTGNSNPAPRSEKIPTLKQISPSPSVSALSKLNDDDLRKKGLEDLLRILRRVEGDYKSLMAEHGNVVKDVNRRFQIFVLETRSLKDVNQKLQDDNQELRDLCCFLDDDRQRGRKLAREWQRFGRYTASVMRSEVAVYQEKLRELEERQSELVTENMELKELCLYLDQERVRMTGDRDEGDGSSNGTVTGHEDGIVAMDTTGSVTPTPSVTPLNNFSLTPSSTVSYIKELELKVHKLEEEKKSLALRIDRNTAEGVDGAVGMNNADDISVLHPGQVLQVHEELEKVPVEEENLDDSEKAIVREMCNVVWRKLGDVGDVGSFNESSDSLLDPPFVPDSPIKPNTSVMSAPGGGVSHGQAHSHSVSQPLPQMASTPLAAYSRAGHPEPASAGAAAQPMDAQPQHKPQERPPHQHQQHPFRPPQEVGQGQPHLPLQNPPGPHPSHPAARGREPHTPTSQPHSFPQPPPPRPGDLDVRGGRQDPAVTERERYIAENEMNFRYSMENPHHPPPPPPPPTWREEDRRNPDQKFPPYYPSDNRARPNQQQQQPSYPGHPQATQMHPQQPARTPPHHGDGPGYPHHPDRPVDMGARDPNHPDRAVVMGARDPNPAPSYHHQGPRDHAPARHQERQPAQPPPPVVPRAHDQQQQQRHPSSSQGYPHPGAPPLKHGGEGNNPGPGRYPQQPAGQGRNNPPPPFSHQPVRLLDAPGVHRHNTATSESGHGLHKMMNQPQRKDDPGPPPLSQPRPRSRGENRYEDRHSAERDQKPNHPTSRSMSSASSSTPSAHAASGHPQGQSMPPPPVSSHPSGGGQGIAGFRAYPPPQSKPGAPPPSWRGGAGGTEMRAAPGGGGGYPPGPAASGGGGYPQGQMGVGGGGGYGPGPTPRPGYGNAPVQGRAGGNPKRFQEQEWRQTYLDDSDTL
ncbi:trithorax group protein osa isoform X2 [Aplysia californica]|uniref:Trithorax group protein osa isoform X2 n=1 Tax=Aplysia californica TaxID=6500 RepID=A0ABM0K232_APLCA|nr:trithorax group protein osa isoform X2 [Aplysia californica]